MRARKGLARRVGRSVVGTIIAITVVASSASAMAATPPASGHDARGRNTPPAVVTPKHFKTIGEAVSAGVLDGDVADELHNRGAAQAIVTVEQDSVVDDASATTAQGSDHDKQMI